MELVGIPRALAVGGCQKATYKDILRQFDEETKRFAEATRKHPDMDIYEIPEINDFMKDADAEKITAYFNNSIRKGY